MSTTAAAKPRSLDPMIGATLCDRYRVERIIGRGGMGLVYLAEQLDVQRMVVIKLLAPQWLDDGTAVTRFAREGSRLQQLAHPNVVQLLEHGHHGDQAFIAMEYLDGEPLRRFLGRHRALSLAEFTPIAAQILAAVGYAHDRGIMLRDIKPANIMLCEHAGKANFVKLLDFGLAKLVDGDDEEVTKSHVIGTAGYLAPEQIKGEPVDLRVDVYAIGVLFYLMLAGASPIVGENDGALLYNHVHGTPKPLGEHLPEGHNVPELLIALVHQCLEKDPERRPADANEITEALFECVPPKLLGLPDADAESRRELREYRDARDRGLEPGAPPVETSSEWTKPVIRAALSPAEVSAAALPQPLRRPTLDGVPQAIADGSGSRASAANATRMGLPSAPSAPVRRAKPIPLPPPPRAGDAPPRGRAKAIGATSSRSSDAALRTDDGVVRSDAPDARAAAAPVKRTAARDVDAPRPAARRGTRVPEPLHPITAPSERSTSNDPPGVELDAAMLITDPAIGATMGMRDSGPLAIGRTLPVRRRWLVAVGLLAVFAGATAAWVLFMPSGEPMPATAVASASAVTPSDASRTAAATPAPSDATPVPVADATAETRGIVEVRALAGARVEVDGVDIGAAPLRLAMRPGTHRFRVIAPGYAVFSETMEVGSGDNPYIEARLKPSKRKPGTAKLEAAVEDVVDPDTAEPDADDDDASANAEPLPDKAPPVQPTTTPGVKRVPPVPPVPPVPDPSKKSEPLLPTQGEPSLDPLLPSG